MMTTERNATYLYIGNVACGNTVHGNELIFDDMPLGSVAIVAAESTTNGGHSAYTTTLVGSPTQKLQVVNRMSTGEIRVSPIFTYGDMIGKTKQAHTPSQRQVSFLGYNGTTISGLESVQALSVGDTFSIKLMFNDRIPYLNNCADIVPIPYYATDATAKTMATSIMGQVMAKFSGTDKPIICDRVATSTSAAITGVTTIAKLVNGSATVYTYTKDADIVPANFTASNGSVTLGDAINIPSYNGRSFTFAAVASVTHIVYIGTKSLYISSANANTTTQAEAIVAAINADTTGLGSICVASNSTLNVTITYRDGYYALPPVVIKDAAGTPLTVVVTPVALTGDVVPVKYVATATTNTTTFTLDKVWQGPTGYVYSGAVENSNIGIATVTTDQWGLKFTGMMSDSLTPTTESYTVVDFDVLAGEYLPTEYKAVAPFKGSGNWMQVKEMENYSQGLDRVNYYAPTEFDVRSYEAVSGKYYDMITVNIIQRPYTSPSTGISPANPFTLVIAVSDLTATAYDYMDAVLAIS